MAEKKAIIIIAPSAELTASGVSMEKLLKKSAVFSNYLAGDVLNGSVENESITHLQLGDIPAALEKDIVLGVLELGSADAAALNDALTLILDAIDRKTVVAVACKSSLALYGAGINAKAGVLSRTATANDILPTLAYITDFPLTNICTGAILYQALKSPNLKREEIAKLKEALIRMEGALARDNREPWDKHDCA